MSNFNKSKYEHSTSMGRAWLVILYLNLMVHYIDRKFRYNLAIKIDCILIDSGHGELYRVQW